ncbi:M56 family metallopeptidase [Kineothrix sp. MSJ-39]|uniref:M56 family metallopeptidase n=1 Tax=Kineothrix sp. MSJ-39 TaxID=2841533 RepID=UPI001C10C7C9|nr:M56 family metallopeptidase [Kineothrix sp. MSJ-39]MBU5429359.1 M56 family metallopeptidase [Kineothrix sp. MSJ-39]
MAMADTLRLLITISVCCCITGFLMWLFLLYNKKASIRILLLCSSLLIIRFLYPYEFPFTHSFYITRGYPELNEFFSKTLPLSSTGLSVAGILLGIWIVGSLWNGFRFLRHYLALQKSISLLPACTNEIILSQLDRILEEKHFKRSEFSIKENDTLESPFVTGFFHPVIVIPGLSLSEKEWYFILSHETAHYRHGDTLYKILIEILLIVFWWNPLFYVFRHKISVCIEQSADLLAIEDLSASEKLDYLECLLKVARQSQHNPLLTSAIPAFDGYADSELQKRFACITKSISNGAAFGNRITKYGFIAAMLLATFLSYGIIVEPSSTEIPADEPDSFTIHTDNSYAVKINDSLFELYVNDTLIGTFKDPENLPEIPIYEKETR